MDVGGGMGVSVGGRSVGVGGAIRELSEQASVKNMMIDPIILVPFLFMVHLFLLRVGISRM